MAAGQLTTVDSRFDGFTQDIRPTSVLETARSSHRSRYIVCLIVRFLVKESTPFFSSLADRDGWATDT